MAHFLRDERVSNLTIADDTLMRINQVFQVRAAAMPDQPPDADNPAHFLTYIIRFDSKGYRVFSLQDLLTHYRQATHVERIIFTLESTIALRNNRTIGSYMELRLDGRDPNSCGLAVSSDTEAWVDGSFCEVREAYAQCKNRNGWLRGAWTHLIIQILGILVGFFLSVWAASNIAPSLAIANAFLISFFFVLVISSNLWFFVNQWFHTLVNVAFPNIKFYRPNRDAIHWLLQALIGGIVVAITLFLINLLSSYMGHVLQNFVGR